jgi:hypothetical protein
MRTPFLLLSCSLLALAASVAAQDKADMRRLKKNIQTLAGSPLEGRGYTKRGLTKAAQLIADNFRQAGLQPLGNDTTFMQYFTFPVNTFPGDLYLKIGRQELLPGKDYLVDASSAAFHAENEKIITVKLGKIKKQKDWERLKTKDLAQPNGVYLLQGTDSFCKQMQISKRTLADSLPKACYLIPQPQKLMWRVSQKANKATVFYIADTAMPRAKRKASIQVAQKFEPAVRSRNVAAFIPGTAVPDSFVVFTAHYDHLGKMGSQTIFPGASDNASGTAMLLFLAHYYARHPQHYSMAFIAFGGEEAGLVGSHYFVENPLFPLSAIRFLTNLDIMGDATEGITVVNATEYPQEFAKLQNSNARKNYLPEIRSRGKAANSDHYFFSEKGVPCFFIYSNSGPGYYHDVYDKPATLSLNNIDQVIRLLQDFVQALQ